MDFGDSRGAYSGLLSPHGTGWGRPYAEKRSIAVPRRPPLPPFTRETALEKVRLAEDAWNSRDPARVALAYTGDSRWRNRSEFFHGRAAIVEFLTRKWAIELDYRLIKELWAFHEDGISVRFQYEWRDDSGRWYRAHGNEQWEFDGDGLMRAAKQASTTWRSRRKSANSYGPPDRVPPPIQA
jgi:uncharacterized protein